MTEDLNLYQPGMKVRYRGPQGVLHGEIVGVASDGLTVRSKPILVNRNNVMTVLCPSCELPMSLWDDKDRTEWYCDGPNDNTDKDGCFNAILIKEHELYQIVRLYQDENHSDHRKVIASDLTLEEAQEHCKRDDTHGDGWFDGFQEQ